MFVRLVPVAKTYPTGTLSLTGNAVNNETVTIKDRVYTWKTTLTGAAMEVLIGGSNAASCDNLVAAIMKGAGEGTSYGTGTPQNQDVTAVRSADTVVLTSTVEGLDGQVATLETMTNATFGAATLLMAGILTTTSAPSLTDATAGVELPPGDQGTLMVHSSAGSGVMTVTLKLWGFNKRLGRWLEMGLLNNGNAIGESGVADALAYAEGVTGLRHFSRILCQITAIAGTGTAVMVHLNVARADGTTQG